MILTYELHQPFNSFFLCSVWCIGYYWTSTFNMEQECDWACLSIGCLEVVAYSL